MGSGVSRPDEEDWDDVPIEKVPVQADGSVQSRMNATKVKDSLTISNDFGRLKTDKRSSQSQEVLEAQAAAHWHRVIAHAREAREAALAAGDEVPCPLCGQMTDDPKFCGFCGDIEEAVQDAQAAEEEMNEKLNSEAKRSSFSLSLFGGDRGRGSESSSPTNSTGSPQGSPSSLRVLWNKDTQSYERVELQPSPTRRSMVIDQDNVRDEMTDMMGMLMAPRGGGGSPESGGGDKRSPGSQSDPYRRSARQRLEDARNEEKIAEERRAAIEARNSPKKRRKFEGLGLDSSSDDDDSTDGMTIAKAKKKLEAYEREDEGWDRDDSDAEGNTAWERSPFFRLLNANTIKDGPQAMKGLRKVINRYDEDPDAGIDVEEAGEAPDPPLPPIEITLKSRTSTTIDLAWDISGEMMGMLEAVQRAYGKDKSPLYQVQYRMHNAQAARGIFERGEAGLSAKEDHPGKDGGDRWKMAVRRTSEHGTTVSRLIPNTPYQFRARRIGWTQLADCQPVVIRSGPGAPACPQGVTAKEVSSDSILLVWQAPEKDNGLPVQQYIVHHKPYKGSFNQVYKGRERCFLVTNLAPNQVHIFQVQATNRAGTGERSDRTAVRTLPEGAQPMSPWVEVIDERSNKMFYCHSKTNAIAWNLPGGGMLDGQASFKNKRSYLQNEMERRMARICQPFGVAQRVLQIAVQRENMLESSLRLLHHTPADDIHAGPIRVRFHGEEGLDAGGLAKDWYQEVARRLHDDSTGLMIQNEDTGYITIDPRAASIHDPAESARLFRAIGTFLAKAIIDKQTLGVNLDPLLLCLLSGKQPTIFVGAELDTSGGDAATEATDPRYTATMNGRGVLQLSEPQFYRGLKWCKHNDVADVDLTFTCSYELFDESKVIELVPYGMNKEVTQENKEEYIALMTHWLFRERYEPALSSLIEGFERHISISKYMRHFTLEELQLLLGGRPDIDVGEIRKNVQFSGGFCADSDQIEWLWHILDEFDVEKLSLFLGFVTGCATMPIDGLDPPLHVTLMEVDGSGLVSEDNHASDDMLPRAHTCFNQIVFPAYSDLGVMKGKIIYALENASEGFYIT